MADKVAATYSRGFRTSWTVFIVAWLLVGVALVVIGLSGLPGLWIPGIVIIAVFGWLLLLARRRFGINGPVITVGPDGYHDRRLGKPIPWSEITSLSTRKSGNRIFLQIGVAEPGRYLENAGMLAKPMERYNPAMGFPALASNLSGMDVPQERILAAAEAWHGAAR